MLGKTILYLLDSDTVRCLCQYLLLEDLAQALNCELTDFAVLPQLRFQLRLAKSDAAIKKLGSEAAVAMAQQLIESASEITIMADSANLLLLLNRPDIDSGEATLFAALCQTNDNSLITGDKRALVSLSQIEGESLLDALWSRLICLEEAIYLILQHTGLEAVSQKIRARPDVNIALSLVFGRCIANELTEVQAGLRSYLNDLKDRTQQKYLLPEYAYFSG